MGRLRTLTILLAMGAGGIATEGARADDSAPPGASTRPQPPVNPTEYVQAGIKLYTKGDLAKAGLYLKAANDYRDMLSAADQAQLDAYRARLTTSAAPTDPAVQPASATVAAPAPAPAAEPAPMAMPMVTASATAPTTGGGVGVMPATAPVAMPGGDTGPGPRLGTTDAKQQARWLLQTAREQGKLGHYDEAEAMVAKADSLGAKWGLFDDTPAKVREAIAKARPKLAPAASADPAASAHTRRNAQAKLKDGRAALAAGQFEQAEAIALEVNSWGLAYGMIEDSPTKLGNAARALRKREQLRNTSPRGQVSQAVYDASVHQARALMAAGQYDQAEAKAREALRLNVVPSLTADRAESVLHDIAMAKARTPQGTAVATRPRPPSRRRRPPAEREANDLLAKNQTQAAAAKFAEAERARALEVQAATPKADPAVHQVQGAVPAPALAAAEPMPAPAVEALPLPEPPAAGRDPPSRRRPGNASAGRQPKRRRAAGRGEGPSSRRASTPSPRRWPRSRRPATTASTPRPIMLLSRHRPGRAGRCPGVSTEAALGASPLSRARPRGPG